MVWALVGLVAIGAFVASGLVGLRQSASADATNVTTTTDTPTTSFYLVIGASASLGIQPTGILSDNGIPTRYGYANDLVRLASARGVALALHKVGCMGETPESMVRATDHCYKAPSSQLTAAVDFLNAHRQATGVVTIDLGFNDLRPCLWVVPFAGQCANDGLASVRTYLPTVISRLKAAAGPHVHLVGLTYADPWLFYFVARPGGATLAQQSASWMDQLNAELTTAYRAGGVAIADVPASFKSSVTTPVATTRWGTIPTNVDRVCEWTWMCQASPYGPDDHPNNAGYLVIAKAILAALPRRL
jgi:hypothetical protein